MENIMEYRKLDPGLVNVLNKMPTSHKQPVEVFVRTTEVPNQKEASFLKELGVRGLNHQRCTFTARLSAEAVTELSHQPWIHNLKLARKMRLA
ncbi:hypothetical protein [Okeania sp. KiyG1]|uniref:hypothetical protein n=1 Tax=Okeania sp. KiyG1 TaxID=2720165 RepID=UPI001922494A|nr:hypothetical protein [Okeania sp. KiyG1]GGA10032.1 hypothetical protein CYANOKiyG1_23020 [Okeania sp. KiyG1]